MRQPGSVVRKSLSDWLKIIIFSLGLFVLFFYVSTSCVDRCSRNENRWAAQAER